MNKRKCSVNVLARTTNAASRTRVICRLKSFAHGLGRKSSAFASYSRGGHLLTVLTATESSGMHSTIRISVLTTSRSRCRSTAHCFFHFAFESDQIAFIFVLFRLVLRLFVLRLTVVVKLKHTIASLPHAVRRSRRLKRSA